MSSSISPWSPVPWIHVASASKSFRRRLPAMKLARCATCVQCTEDTRRPKAWRHSATICPSRPKGWTRCGEWLAQSMALLRSALRQGVVRLWVGTKVQVGPTASREHAGELEGGEGCSPRRRIRSACSWRLTRRFASTRKTPRPGVSGLASGTEGAVARSTARRVHHSQHHLEHHLEHHLQHHVLAAPLAAPRAAPLAAQLAAPLAARVHGKARRWQAGKRPRGGMVGRERQRD
mmetsp:Transcript_12658/g.28848  ORF Transcript_12658/g.28848 Transcript_12658/m.28848 type:complete len:234 (+) Transcript_12658:481-1182(+)